ncbi:MAG: succinate dehydrogenase assembly factor 2 [Sphingopyxis sp.]
MNANLIDPETRLRRLSYRAWHRGTREADFLVGGFFDRYSAGWSEADLAWFEAIIDEQDVDILSWAFGRADPPARLMGGAADALVAALRRLDYIAIPR